MTDLNRVFFPLRSNVGWFQSADLRSQIADRVKQALLIYDEVVVEDGTYMAAITEHGSSAPYLPPGYLPDDERIIEFERDLKPDNLIIGIGPDGQMPTDWVNYGMTSARYKIDYFDIFRGINLSSYNFIKPVIVQDFAFPPEAKELIQRNSFEDSYRFRDIDSNTFAKDLIIKSLNRDLIASILLRSAIILDARHGSLLQRKSQIPKEGVQLSPVKEQVVVRRLISVAAPDFSSLSIERVLELREDTLWQDFRNYVSEILSSIGSDPEMLVDERAFEDRVRNKVERDLFEARKERHMTGKKLSVDLGLGVTSLIPGYGILSTVAGMAKSTDQYLRDRSGWFAFLLKLEGDE
jgi:hypothetical protein